MREIKFRLWDKTEKEMIYLDKVGDRQHHTFGIRKDGSLDYYNLQNGSGGDEYILMQYTGLRDQNGIEICEGDVVKGYSVYPTASTFESFLMGEVYYTNRGTWDCCSYILGGFNEQVEVIGNIHSNPELLESEGN